MDKKAFAAALKPLQKEPLLGLPPDPELAALTNQFYPDFEIDESGKAVFASEDSADLNRLFERCGLRLRVEESVEPVINEAYQFCSVYLAKFLDMAVRRPSDFEYMTRDWPDDWKQYTVSVVRGDKEAAKAYATKLMPLAPDCPYPPLLRPYRYNNMPTPLLTKSSAFDEGGE
jgi:hypothetical protein